MVPPGRHNSAVRPYRIRSAPAHEHRPFARGDLVTVINQSPETFPLEPYGYRVLRGASSDSAAS
jgi:hypothetical protein